MVVFYRCIVLLSVLGGIMKIRNWRIVLVIVGLLNALPSYAWTKLHYKELTSHERSMTAQDGSFCFKKAGVVPFSQLIFSWNALRPMQGHYTFLVQARNAQTQQWSQWHKMMEWGADVQRSYISSPGDFVRYHFVRLEVDKQSLADAFCIKVQTSEGASLQQFHALAVTTANFHTFKAEPVQIAKTLPTVMVPGVPQISQFTLDHARNDCLCSPTSCCMALNYVTGSSIDPLHYAEKVFDQGLDIYGNWPLNVAHGFEYCKDTASFIVTRLPSFSILHQQLTSGMPVVVSIRGPLEGATRPYKNGHLLVVTGWDSQRQAVVCNDPGAQEGEPIMRHYPIASFLRAWERSNRLAYVFKPFKKRG